MDRVLSPPVIQADLQLVFLALAVCIGASLVTFALFSHVLARGARSRGWLLLNGLCTGVGIWATSLIMALAQTVSVEHYEPFNGAFAFAVAAVMTMLGFILAARPGRLMAWGGGAAIGTGAGLAYMANMAAFHPGNVFWRWGLLALGLALGGMLAGAAFAAFREFVGLRARLAGAALMTAAIMGMMLTGIGASSFSTYISEPHPDPLDGPLIALGTAIAAALVLIAGAVVAALDGRAISATFARLGELLDAMPDGVVLADAGTIIGVNARLLQLAGCKEGELLGKQVFGDLFATWQRQVAPGRSLIFDTPLITNTSVTIPVKVLRRPLHALGRANEVYTVRDLRERAEARDKIAELTQELGQKDQDLQRRNFLLEMVLANVMEGMCMFDAQGRVVLSNERYATIFGLSPGDVLPGTRQRDIAQKCIDKGLYACGSPQAYLEDRLEAAETSRDLVHELSDGRIISIAERPMPGGGWVATLEDVTERRRMEAENLHLSHYDPLTFLPNRTSLRRLLAELLVRAGAKKRRLAVLMVNIDHFREVNDTLGHQAGDALLKAIADRLRAFTRKTTLLGRIGDDEFVLVEAVDRPDWDAAALASRVQEQLRQPFNLDGTILKMDATIGIAVSPADGQDADLLLKRADLALYRAKGQARGTHQFFDPTMEKHLKERMGLQHDLGEALVRGQFELHYQPLVSLAKKEIVGFETLLRWRHRERGLLLPDAFIPAAEAAGLVPAIGEWMLRQACSEAMRWPPPLKVSVNVLAAQFKSPDFVQTVISALALAGLNAQRLEIEISETMILDDRDAALAIVRRLGELGVLIALDDFGTGFSSFSSLRDFPFQRVKIDSAFFASPAQKGDSQVMVRALLRLGAGFGATTTAEGVETQEQYDFVQQEGFTEMQGEYFSQPKTADEIRRMFLPPASVSAVA